MSRLPPECLARPIAHRGLHHAAAGLVENSPSAIQAALAGGYGIELDVQPSSDGVAMVFHDDRLDRLTAETGPIAERSAETLGRIRLNGSDDTIPTLAATLEVVAGRAPLLIELKDQDGALGPEIAWLYEAVARELASYEGPVAVMSFSAQTMRAFADTLPHVPAGLVTCAFTEEFWPDVPAARRASLAAIEAAEAFEVDFISHQLRDLTMPRVAELKARGLRILSWTTKSLEDDRLARRVADNVTFEGYVPED